MIPPLARLLRERWPELRPGRPPVATAIVAGLDRSPAGKVTLVFFDQAGDLAAVAKVARSPASEPALVREYLRHLGAHRATARGLGSHLWASAYHDTFSRLGRIAAPTLVLLVATACGVR